MSYIITDKLHFKKNPKFKKKKDFKNLYFYNFKRNIFNK